MLCGALRNGVIVIGFAVQDESLGNKHRTRDGERKRKPGA
jgi:hypothetical protein